MNILVTGGTGYVGSRLVPELRKNHSVDVVDLCMFRKTDDAIMLDINELNDADISWADAIIHLAGLSNDPMAHFSPRLNFVVNAADTVHLAYRAKHLGVARFILASSASLYQGITRPDMAAPANRDIAPKEPYAISKVMAESGCMSLADDDFQVIALRKGTIGGWSPRMRFDLMVNTLFAAAMQQGEITVFTDKAGRSVMRPHLDIRDAVARYCEALSLPTGIYNVASQNVNVAEVAEAVASATGASVVRKVVNDPTLLRDYVMSFTRGLWTVADTVQELVKMEPSFDYNDDNCYNIRVWKEYNS